jgi:hypothetical protein
VAALCFFGTQGTKDEWAGVDIDSTTDVRHDINRCCAATQPGLDGVKKLNDGNDDKRQVMASSSSVAASEKESIVRVAR